MQEAQDTEQEENEQEFVSKQLKALALQTGDKVALVAAGSRAKNPAVVKRCQQMIAEMGFNPVVGKHALRYSGFSAGTDQERLEDIDTAILDESTRAILFLTGGYGAIRLLPLLDFAQIRQNPKIFLGSGDNDALLLAINHLTGLVVFHGPNLDEVQDKYTYDAMKSTLLGSGERRTINCRDESDLSFEHCAYSLSNKVVRGITCGGNLTALSTLFGTRYVPDLAGKILTLDDAGDRNSILDRWFTTLYLSGTLSSCAGIAFGGFPDCHPRGGTNMLSIEDTFGDRIKELGTAACFGFKFGTPSKSNIVPIGIEAELDCGKGVLSFNESSLS